MPTGIHTSAFLKKYIEETSQENINMDITNPIVCKHHERLATKRIKSSSETDLHYSRTNNSALKIIVRQLEAAASCVEIITQFE
ncbi:23987_t:CDS:2 [Gigaspora rosea]|nr:23987_t:CDS:2 [Gigaspora rosea]